MSTQLPSRVHSFAISAFRKSSSYRLPLAGNCPSCTALAARCCSLSSLGHRAVVRGQRDFAEKATRRSPSTRPIRWSGWCCWPDLGLSASLLRRIRYLVLDPHIGLDKVSAQKSAGVAFGVSLALTLVFGLKLFGVL